MNWRTKERKEIVPQLGIGKLKLVEKQGEAMRMEGQKVYIGGGTGRRNV